MVAVVQFNGISLDVAPYHIETVEGLLGSPDIRSSDQTRVARDGVIMGRDLYGARAVTIAINIEAATEAAFGTAVGAFTAAFTAPQTVEIPLTFTIPGVAGGVAARLNVRPRKVALPQPSLWFDNVGHAVVELVATDPLIYSEAETTVSMELAAAAGGRTYNRVYPVVYGGGGSYGSVVVNNLGSTVAPVQIRINGPVTNPEVRNVTTGQSLGFTIVLAAGEFLDVDTATRTVLLGGTANRYSTLTTPQWWGLVPGNNEIRYLADITTASTTTLTWRSAWV